MLHTVMGKQQKPRWLPVLALAIFYSGISGSPFPQPVLTGPSLAYVGSRMAFHCSAPDPSPSVAYRLMKDHAVVIGTATNLEGNQPASFYLKVAETSEGLYHCMVLRIGEAAISNGIRFSVVTPPAATTVTSDPWPPAVYEGQRVVLSCEVARGSHLSYTWFFNRKEVTPSSREPPMQVDGPRLVIERATQGHDGYYYCMAWSIAQDVKRFSSSTELHVGVKVYASKPTISFSVSKEGSYYHANVTCRSSRGTPPLNFSLTIDNREVGWLASGASLAAWFQVPIVPGLDVGAARCWLLNEAQELGSDPLALEVVPVGGHASVNVQYLYGDDLKVAAAKLGCHVDRGTFPLISWLFNDSVLAPEHGPGAHGRAGPPHYALVDHGRVLVLARFDQGDSGYYRCKARDSYDQSGRWVESPPVLVQVGDVPVATTEVIAIGFCFFLLISLAVGVACLCILTARHQGHALISARDPNVDWLHLSTLASQSGDTPHDGDPTDSDKHN